MTHRVWISIIGIIFALGGITSHVSARPMYHHRHRRVAAVSMMRRSGWRRSTGRRQAWITGDRQTHGYYLRRAGRALPSRANRMYFRTVADARAAGYQPARQGAVPVDPRLTWRNRRGLLSLGRHHEPPPQSMQKPTAPPGAQQPPVTPTQPMPN